MSRFPIRRLCAFLLLLCVTQIQPGWADTGSLVVEHPQIRATLPGAPVAAGYLMIRNDGSVADRLTGFRADFSGKTEIHNMEMDDGVMKMRPVPQGLEIPPGGSIVLAPGGLHLMFMKLEEPMVAGTKRQIILVFENAGEIPLEMPVVGPDEIKKHGEEMDHSNHQ